MQYDINEIRDSFKTDTYAKLSGIEIDSASDEEVVCSMKITKDHMNAVGGVQGGAIFTLADLAFAVHTNLPNKNDPDYGIVVGQSCSISYLKGTRGTVLYAKSRLLHRGRKVVVVGITIVDDLGVVLADLLCNGSVTDRKI